MTLHFLLRLLDNLFRHPIRYLAPIVVLGAIGFLTISSDETYETTGVVFVEESSFLSSLTDVNQDSSFFFSSPADVAVDQLQGLMGTTTFPIEVLRRVENDPDGDYSNAAIFALRQQVVVGSRQGSLLQVTGSASDPVTAQAISSAVIDQFTEWQIEADLAQSQAAEEFLVGQQADRLAELEAAEAARASFLLLNPDPVEGASRPTSEEIALAELEDDVTTARERYEAARSDVQTAQLATSQTVTDIQASFRVVDPPAVPTSPESKVVGSLMQIAIFILLGVGASLGVLILTTFTDTSVRFPSEIRDRLGKEPLAVVPRAS